jgi:Domain of unknown function (DUF1772)
VGKIQLSDLLLAGAVFFYSLNLGPMMFESFTSDRTWASNPPDSFSMFLGQYGQKTAHYWRIVSPLALVSFVLSLIFNWQIADRRLWLSVAFVLYLAIQMSTIAYFVPVQEELISDSGSVARELLKSRADRWVFLNYFRIVAGVLAFAFLLRAILVPRMP